MTAGAPIPQGLLQEWVHSHEEDTEGQQVFRPGDFDFPPARGREGFVLQADGHYVDEGFAPNDATLTRPGTWTLGLDKVLTLFPTGGSPRRFTMISFAPDRLVLSPIR